MEGRQHERIGDRSIQPPGSFEPGIPLISFRACFHARCTTHDIDRCSLCASFWISSSITSGKYRLCLRLSLFEASLELLRSWSVMGLAAFLHALGARVEGGR